MKKEKKFKKVVKLHEPGLEGLAALTVFAAVVFAIRGVIISIGSPQFNVIAILWVVFSAMAPMVLIQARQYGDTHYKELENDKTTSSKRKKEKKKYEKVVELDQEALKFFKGLTTIVVAIFSVYGFISSIGSVFFYVAILMWIASGGIMAAIAIFEAETYYEEIEGGVNDD